MSSSPGLIALGITATAAVVFLGLSFGRVHTLEYALDWDHLRQTVGETTLSSGLHFLGAPWHSLVIYPGTLQNMIFSTSDSPTDELHTRTADGLQVVLEITYQYQLTVTELHHLFDDFGPNGYPAVYFDVASHLISEEATTYSAYEFFNSKEAIAVAMQSKLDTYFQQHLHAHVISLQIQSCRLPDAFNAAITDTVTQRQNITNAAKYLDQQTVSLQTNLVVAGKQANATVATAEGNAKQILLQAEAASAMATQNGAAEAEAFSNVKARLGFTNDELLRYVWWDAVGGATSTQNSGNSGGVGGNGGSSSASSLLVGVNPSTMIQQATVQPT